MKKNVDIAAKDTASSIDNKIQPIKSKKVSKHLKQDYESRIAAVRGCIVDLDNLCLVVPGYHQIAKDMNYGKAQEAGKSAY